MTVQIRPWLPQDTPYLVEVLLRVQQQDGYPARIDATSEALETWLTGPDVIERLLAESDHKVIGQVEIARPRPYLSRYVEAKHPDMTLSRCLEIRHLFVAPEARRQGAGEDLVREALTMVHSQNMHGLVAAIGPESTQRLYEGIGFDVLGTFVGLDGRNTVMVNRSTP